MCPSSPPVSRVVGYRAPKWVQSVIREEWTAEVFDLELMRYSNIEEEMIEMLQITMACIARMQHQRPKMSDVLKMVENVQQFDNGTVFLQ
ncbi:hypothetical protein GIB67_025175, partial [Kingdonia uniflora]